MPEAVKFGRSPGGDRSVALPILKTLAVSLALAAAPALALAHAHESSHPPCGAAAGGLPDPAETKRCLAERFKPAKDKPPAPAPAPPAPSTTEPTSTN